MDKFRLSSTTIENITARKACREEVSRVLFRCNSEIGSAKVLCFGNRNIEYDIV